VSVSGMTGPGTVIATVGAGVAHDAAANANTASTSTDNTVTYVNVPFTDDPLIAGTTVVKAVHITELRSHIDAIRMAVSLGAYSWTDTLAPGAMYIRAKHITEMRAALQDAYVARGAPPPPIYTDPNLGAGATIKVAHIAEIRAAVVAIN